MKIHELTYCMTERSLSFLLQAIADLRDHLWITNSVLSRRTPRSDPPSLQPGKNRTYNFSLKCFHTSSSALSTPSPHWRGFCVSVSLSFSVDSIAPLATFFFVVSSHFYSILCNSSNRNSTMNNNMMFHTII